MKSKRTLIVTFAIILVLVIALCSLYPILLMRTTATGKIEGTKVIALKNNNNSLYFYQTDIGFIMIDAGSNLDTIKKSLRTIGIQPSEVKWIFLTHSDTDHLSSLPLFTQAEIYMSEDELVMIDGTKKRSFLMGKNKLPKSIDIPKIKLLHDQQQLVLGNTNIRAIKMPGHTPGSMVYLINEEYFFTGDALSVIKGKIGVHPFTMDKQQALESIENVKNLKTVINLIFTAHYGYYSFSELN